MSVIYAHTSLNKCNLRCASTQLPIHKQNPDGDALVMHKICPIIQIL